MRQRMVISGRGGSHNAPLRESKHIFRGDGPEVNSPVRRTSTTGGPNEHTRPMTRRNEDAPSIARIRIVASLMCADPAALPQEVQVLEAAGIDGLHFDIMDGRFVPNTALDPEILVSLRPLTRISFEAHLMVRDPLPLLGRLADGGCDVCLVHAESEGDLAATVAAARAAGMEVGVALNPGTPPSCLDPVLPSLDRVLIMTVEPGFAGQPMVEGAAAKVAAAAAHASAAESRAVIEADGNINPATVGPLVRAGARVLVGGSSGLFVLGAPRAAALSRLRAAAEGQEG